MEIDFIENYNRVEAYKSEPGLTLNQTALLRVCVEDALITSGYFEGHARETTKDHVLFEYNELLKTLEHIMSI